jgi:hypothetical protein
VIAFPLDAVILSETPRLKVVTPLEMPHPSSGVTLWPLPGIVWPFAGLVKVQVNVYGA